MPTVPRRPSVSASRAGRTPKTVLVTGASGGLGHAVCSAFGREGWQVGVHYHERRKEAEQTLDSVCRSGGTGALFQADITHAAEVDAMIRGLLAGWDRLDVLVCNAGVASSRLIIRHSTEEWTRVVETNLTGTFHCLKTAASSMIARRDGSIIVVGSYASIQGTTGQAAYAASKAGLIGLVRTAAREWGAANVRVNLMFPGWHKTQLSGSAMTELEGFADHVLGRSPDIEQVGRTIYYLSQQQDVSGQVWNLDSRVL
ncbi:MAG: SDR family NAD(P)-dependent oxidoreductase [Nitrospiraceae bacterium]